MCLAEELRQCIARREQRTGNGINKRVLAERIGIVPSTLYLWLGGESVPRRELLLSLLIELEVPEGRRWAILNARDSLAIAERKRRRPQDVSSPQTGSSEVPWLDEYVRLRTLMASGRVTETVTIAREIASGAHDPFRVAQAWLFVLGGSLNLRDQTAAWAAVEESSRALRHCRDPRLLGEFHTLAAWLAHLLGSMERYAMHVVSAERALARLTEGSVAVSDAWLDLAITYSICGFHESATAARVRARAVAAACGAGEWETGGGMEVAVRHAIWLDHCGDSARAARYLGEALARLPDDLTSLDRRDLCWAQYAARRLDALGDRCRLDVSSLQPERDESRDFRDLTLLSEVCASIAAGHTTSALLRLDSADIDPLTVGQAELHRLRSMAYAAAGDFRAALDESARATRITVTEVTQLRAQLLDHTKAQLDRERLQRVAARHTDAVFVDTVTGLPNRARLDLFVSELAQRDAGAMIGAVSLTSLLSAIADECEVSANILLQRAAGIAARGVRAGQLLARGDQEHLVLVLPDASEPDAVETGRHLVSALKSENWHSIVPHLSITAEVAWVSLPADASAETAQRCVERAIFQAHRAGGGERSDPAGAWLPEGMAVNSAFRVTPVPS